MRVKMAFRNALRSFRGTLIDGLLQPNVRLGNGLNLNKNHSLDEENAEKDIENARASKDFRRAQLEVQKLRPWEMTKGRPRNKRLQIRARTFDEREIALDERQVALDTREVAVSEREAALRKRENALRREIFALDKRENALKKGGTGSFERAAALDSREAQLNNKHQQLLNKEEQLFLQTQSMRNQQTDQPELNAKKALEEAKDLVKLRKKAYILEQRRAGNTLPPKSSDKSSESGKPVAAAMSDPESSTQSSMAPEIEIEIESASDYDNIFPYTDDSSYLDARTRIVLPRRPAP
ncbi:uncharacterized protein N0V89_002984 [Didymosphaeria variabile]|uniref:Uncharacterized protein n=1 Tax=Didymosphaeria variabile TaxID=1932322 RepID=A0A9W9CEX0_9PLEO|nr:uncharacterized protein N0V89_002984 [Didymosphaeria variabile]KAJ4358402.1 hypothetical protein N0V89_002984 [Didymosphaeria variabile]